MSKTISSTSIRGYRLKFNTEKHQYTLYTNAVSPMKVPSVTTVLSVLAKPGLQAWALNKMGDYILENYDEGMTLDNLSNLVDTAKQAHRVHSAKAADIGAIAHDWIEKYLMGIFKFIPQNEAAAPIQAWLDWWGQETRKPVTVEGLVAHSSYFYAGKFDLLMRDDRGLVVVDIKTSSGIYPEYILQLGAYALAIKDWMGAEVDRGLIVRVGKDGKLETAEYDLERPKELFLSALALFKFMEGFKQTPGTVL